MSFSGISIGDVLMLSQLSWKIGCAFTAGRAGAPAQFQEVENELKSLTTAITLLAENIDEDGGLLARSDHKTKEGLDKILGCCRQTLDSLDAFVTQYQEVRKPDEVGGLATRRSWRQVLLKNYKTVMWTTEGGTIQSLRNMLAMHTQSISLTMQALQSRSLSRLERIIEPVADQIDDMHSKLNGDLDVKIDEVHNVMLSLKASIDQSPMIWPIRRGSTAMSRLSPPVSPHLVGMHKDLLPKSKDRDSHGALSVGSNIHTPQLSDSEFSAPSPPSRQLSPGPDIRGSISIPTDFRFSDAPPQYSEKRKPRASRNSHVELYSPKSRARVSELDSDRTPIDEARSPISPQSMDFPSMLPPPAIATDTAIPGQMSEQDVITPAPEQKIVTPPAIQGVISHSPRLERNIHAFSDLPEVSGVATTREQSAFERKLFTHSTTLCEVRGLSVEYTQPDEVNPEEWRMEQACKECKICIITKQQKLASGAMRFLTSIWVLSDDRRVRLQQKIAEGEEVLPYTVWGNEAKVVLRVPTELKYHDVNLEGTSIKTAKTAWVNYVFENERGASAFQNALVGKTLLLSVKTKRTMRLHDGIAATFSYAEQLCGLENLRIFQDDAGGTMALLHYSPHIQDGYMAFYLNSARDPVRLRDEGGLGVKIKGLRIGLEGREGGRRRSAAGSVGGGGSGTGSGGLVGLGEVPPLKSPKLKGDRMVTGAKIEFYTELDKRLFQDKFREIQGQFFAG